MILAYCESPRHLPLLDRIEPRPVVMREWLAVVQAARRADRIVLIVESLSKWPFVDELRALRQIVPGIPFVLVTSGGESNLLEMHRFEVEEAIVLGRHDHLPTVVRDARVTAFRLAMAQSVSNLQEIDLHLRDLFRALFLAPSPVLTVEGWGKLVGLKPSTEWQLLLHARLSVLLAVWDCRLACDPD